MKIIGVNVNCVTNKNKKGSFVYGIRNKKTNKYYVGSSTNKRGIIVRIRRHINQLKLGNHHSIKLQNSFNKYNMNFNYWEFILFEEIDKNQYKEKEQYYIDKYNAYYDGYNSTPIVGVVNHGKLSIKHKNAISKSKQNLSDDDILNIFIKYNSGLNYTEIGHYYNLTSPTISSIINKPHYYQEIKEKYSLTKLWFQYIFYNKNENKFYRVDNFSKFCRKMNLNNKMMMPLMLNKFKMTFIGNWTAFKREDFTISELKIRVNIDNYRHTLYKEGIKYEFKNVREFCKNKKLDETSVYNVLNGNKKTIKGFTISK